MPHEFTTSYIKDSIDLFRYYKNLAERAMAQCPDAALFTALDAESNSIAVIVKHMSGNMRSRWSDFLTSDGEKPDRNRDTEFEEPPETRAELLQLWERGWKYVFDALQPLTDADSLDIGQEFFELHFSAIRAFAFGEHKLRQAERAIGLAVLGLAARRTQKFLSRHPVFREK